ncbi:UDP-N-acetylglucosamine pyrophosphorylase [Mortierella sp. 14UC]|nr:UDP-N-acetylglucosamine pyrophosphorylase [Mortierella sp. 14UC]
MTKAVDPARLCIVRQKYKDADQGHVLTFRDRLCPQQQHSFFSQVESIDPKAFNTIFREAVHASKSTATFTDLQPLAHSEDKSTTHSPLSEQQDWIQRGLDAIALNQLAVIVLAGGQGVIPSFDLEGKILLSAKDQLAISPNGNGGIFWALYTEGVLEILQKRSILYTHIYSVDNILIKIGDPVGIGHPLATDADVTAKVMPKAHATEPLGPICHINGQIKVIEYSEMDPDLAALVDPETGEFVYRAGNVCNQIFSVDFLARLPPILQTPEQELLIYHPATKRISFIDL